MSSIDHAGHTWRSTLIPLDVALARVIAACRPLEPVQVALAEALGGVTTEDVTSGEAIPPFANTAMDGYAVRAADTSSAPGQAGGNRDHRCGRGAGPAGGARPGGADHDGGADASRG